ncbi:RluA family pseudouridine synthase [Paranoxybacillus vitaminiphilus]|uniref:RluA family pseudouridine synthase n=1 Tax=Paranoxybacillus vitaminiphilus TaxID=581036 RepID=UPI000DB9D703|nr:RluA family pseudouridine synthase [Anoxybacillus vitaminiphilus]
MTKRKGEWVEFISNWNGHTIELFLKDVWKAPKKLIHQLRMDKGIKVNGQEVKWTTPLLPNDRLQIWLYKPEPVSAKPTYSELDILFEDDHLLMINKRAGVDVHPATPEQTDTLANAVAFHLQCQGIFTKVRHIHRLDRDTTGAILFAKHALAGAMLDRMLAQRQIKRTYVALVHGIMKKKTGTIDAPIGRDRHHPTRRRVSKTGEKAVTHYRVLEFFQNEQLSLVQLTLDTGRTHQIRVHMSYIGHPLVGDVLYGGSDHFTSRQALHAAKIEFLHPITNESVSCIAPFQDDAFTKAIDLCSYFS